jgi:DNA modification methylase
MARRPTHPADTPAPRGNRPKFVPNTPKGTTFKKPALELFTSTLWEYPSQHYMPDHAGAGGRPTVQGDPNYPGATPSWVIWQLIQRYTKPGERVLDPMCGSGTTLDVCADLAREAKGFDINPTRPDIEPADARKLPLPDACCDLVFVDPPYSTHINYSDQPGCIGKLDAGGRDGGRAYYQAMAQVIAEIDRVLRPGRHASLYVSDSRREAGEGRAEFMPIGFELFSMLRERFEPVDIVAVVRRNTKLHERGRISRARETNALERGFNYLFIMRKPGPRTR